jgi:RNA polymerase sigma-70 factor (ECF subfamily)
MAEEFFDARGRWKIGASHWSAPDRSLEQSQFWHAFGDCIVHLPPRLAKPFVLKEIEGFSGEEICRKLHISTTNNLWVMLSRARMRLRQCLDLKWFSKTTKGNR